MKSRVRREKLQNILNREKIDCAIYTLGANLQYLLNDQSLVYQRTGYSKMLKGEGYFSGLNLAEYLLVIPAQGEAFLISQPHHQASLEKYGLKIITSFISHFPYYFFQELKAQRIAIGMDAHDSFAQLFKDYDSSLEIIKGETLTDELRVIKDSEEIQLLKKAAAITDQVMAATIPLLIEGSVPVDVEAFIHKKGEALGATDVSFPAACIYTRPGHPSAQERIGYPKQMPLKGNTSIAFDFGFIIEGYCSDFGRSFYRGEPPQKVVDAYGALQKGQIRMLEEIKPFQHKLSDIDRLIRERVTDLGFGEQMLYGDTGICGHQIGIDVHEDPWLINSENDLLRPGMVFCVEPKIWFPGECYMRVEDMVLITETGAESLTVFDRNLYSLD